MSINRGSTNDYDSNGMAPLLLAIFIGNIDIVRQLLKDGADPNKPQRDDVAATPLWHAQEDFGLLEIAELLKEHGARMA